MPVGGSDFPFHPIKPSLHLQCPSLFCPRIFTHFTPRRASTFNKAGGICGVLAGVKGVSISSSEVLDWGCPGCPMASSQRILLTGVGKRVVPLVPEMRCCSSVSSVLSSVIPAAGLQRADLNISRMTYRHQKHLSTCSHLGAPFKIC